MFKINVVCRGASMLFYPAALPLSRQTLTYDLGAQIVAGEPGDAKSMRHALAAVYAGATEGANG